ncbi:MAG: hypothetical protein AB1629_05700 [Candidatus Omnitrophota bacterium]
MNQMPAPTEKDYIIIQSGAILEDTYRLDLSYDMSKPSTYSIECNKWQLDMLSDINITSNTIQIEVKGKESQEISPFLQCQKNEDCKAVTDYCNCKQICVNKFTELENCVGQGKKCKSNVRSIVCYCENNQCVEGSRE